MTFLRKLFGSTSKSDDGSVKTLVCPKCGARHALTQTSFMMSPEQAISLLPRDSIVLPVGGHSTEYMVGELHTFPPDVNLGLKQFTIQSIVKVSMGLNKGQTATWICRNCGTGGNSFPADWADADALHDSSTQKMESYLKDWAQSKGIDPRKFKGL